MWRYCSTVRPIISTGFSGTGRQERLSPEDRVRALKLLEMQHNSLLMFTSCGWFFDEISGLETRQILKYACRAIQLARDFGRDLEPLLLSHLSQAPSNLEEYRDAGGFGSGLSGHRPWT